MGVIQPYVKIMLKPFAIVDVLEMTVLKAPNRHSLLYMTALVDEQFQTSFAEEDLAEKPLQVIGQLREKNAQNGNMEDVEKILFCGKADSMAIVRIGNTFQLRLTASSHSKALDVKKYSRTYQQPEMTYQDAMNQAAAQCNGKLMDKVTEGKAIDGLAVQYQETAWEFIKRLASHFGAPLIVEDKTEEPAIIVGMPEKADIGKLGDFQYSVKKDVEAFRAASENGETIQEKDLIVYEIITDSIYEIGDSATFLDETYYIQQARLSIRKGKLYNRYRLSTKEGFFQPKISNSHIVGLSLEGIVEEVLADKVKIRLDMDREDETAAGQALYPFLYATSYTAQGGGFYCMPEIGEKVRLYFPDTVEKNAFAQSCVRTNFEEEGDYGNPDIKYFRTKDGKEIKIMPEGICIICQDDQIFISLEEENGISLQSSKPIQVLATDGADITLNAEGSIVLSAGKELDISCNGSKINMKGGTTKIRGTSITEN